MKLKRPFSRPFIEKLDAKLLLNKPATWSTRIHLVLYYGGIFIIGIVFFGFLLPNDARANSNVGVWVSLLAVLASIGFIVWLIYLLRFNVFKRFGIQKAGDGIKSFALYFAAIAIFVGIPFLPPGIESVRANLAYTNDEVVADYNKMCENIVKLEYDSLDHRWDRTTIILDTIGVVEVDNPDALNYTEEGGKVERRDSLAFHNSMYAADSLKKLSDTSYILYQCPNYVFLNPGSIDRHSDLNQVYSIDIYKKVVKNFQRPDRKQIAAELETLIAKYKNGDNGNRYYRYDYSRDAETGMRANYFERLTLRYSTIDVTSSIENIINQKDRWKGGDWVIPFRIFYYVTLSLTILLFLFRHGTVAGFFLTPLVLILLSIITTTFLVASFRPDVFILPLMIFYWVIFVILGITGVNYTVRRSIAGIGLNSFMMGLPFIPLMVVGAYYTFLHSRPYDERIPGYFENENLHLLIAEIAGSIILFILIEPVFKRLYRKWYSLPEA